MNDDSDPSELLPPANPLPPVAEPVPLAPVLGYASSAVNYKPRPPIPGVVRFAGYTAGSALPIICFLFAIAGYPDGPDWQSGRFEDYVKLFLSARSAWPFFPLLIYSMACMLRVCINPQRNGPRPLYRVAIYGGVILAAQFCVIMVISLGGATDEGVIRVVGAGAIAILIPAGLLALLNFSFRRFGVASVWQSIAYIVVVTLLAGLLISARGVLGAILGGAFASLIIAPGWALATFITVAILIRRLPRDQGDLKRPSMTLLLPAWLTAYAASWALAVQQAIRAYHDLPTTPPHRCYIASAAAKGHCRFVRTRHTCAGACINVQLQRLKCGEIALATLTPRLHQLIRSIYDRIGPAMAAAMIHPLLADLAYLLLKPAEWMTLFLLRPTVKQFDQLAAGIYLNDKPASADANLRAEPNCQ